MSTNPRKRPVEQDVEIVGTKRIARAPKPTQATPPTPAEKEEEEDVFELAVKLHTKFDSLPPKLRSTLEQAYETTIRAQMDALSSGTAPTQKHTFSLIRGHCVRPSNTGFTLTTCKEGIADVSLANIELLKQGFTSWKTAGISKRNFVELKTKEGIMNPDFIHLHSVRHGELSWGLDTHGCLSLYSTTIEESRLKEKVLYVQRKEIGVKDEV